MHVQMISKCLSTAMLVITIVLWTSSIHAEPILLKALGDDDSDYVLFDHTFDPALPTRLHFVGSAENRKTPQDAATGVRFCFIEEVPNGLSQLGDCTDFIQIPPPVNVGEYIPVPIDLYLEIPNSPARVGLFVEGGGPNDNTYVLGTFDHQVVPEPSTLAMAGAAALMLVGWRRMRAKRLARVAT